MTKYAINTSQFTVGLTGLKKEVPLEGWVELGTEEATHPEVQESVRRGWIKLSVTKPDGSGSFTPKIEISEPAVHGSKTIPKKKKEATQ